VNRGLTGLVGDWRFCKGSSFARMPTSQNRDMGYPANCLRLAPVAGVPGDLAGCCEIALISGFVDGGLPAFVLDPAAQFDVLVDSFYG
jgi:hypothetical protein